MYAILANFDEPILNWSRYLQANALVNAEISYYLKIARRFYDVLTVYFSSYDLFFISTTLSAIIFSPKP